MHYYQRVSTPLSPNRESPFNAHGSPVLSQYWLIPASAAFQKPASDTIPSAYHTSLLLCLEGSVPAVLRHVAGFPNLRLLRRLRRPASPQPQQVQIDSGRIAEPPMFTMLLSAPERRPLLYPRPLLLIRRIWPLAFTL